MENNIILPSKAKIEDTVTNELRFFQLHGKLILSQIIGQYFDIKKVYIKQDSSVLPEMIHEDDYKDQKESWFYDEETSQEIYINPNTTGDHNDLMKIFFKRSLYTHTYDRSYPKLDNMLAQIFGLTGFFSIMFILYRGYN